MPWLRLLRTLTWPLLAAGLALTAVHPAAAQSAAPRDVLRDITDVVGLKPRFELLATDKVQNAAAVVYGGKRFLLYNPQFVATVNRAGHTDWAGTSILAHEMGHHLNGHTLRRGGSNPADELEADEFSGFVLRKLGASLAQAQAGMAVVSDEEASPTHPGRAARLQAIGAGWQRANQQIAASQRAAAPSAAPATVPAAEPVRRATPPLVATAGEAASPVIGKITFHDKPDQPYYLTRLLNVVRLDHDDHTAEVIGHLTRAASSSGYVYMLVDSQQRRLFVSSAGAIFDAQGRQVARLSDPL